jgi:hypothetical protein
MFAGGDQPSNHFGDKLGISVSWIRNPSLIEPIHLPNVIIKSATILYADVRSGTMNVGSVIMDSLTIGQTMPGTFHMYGTTFFESGPVNIGTATSPKSLNILGNIVAYSTTGSRFNALNIIESTAALPAYAPQLLFVNNSSSTGTVRSDIIEPVVTLSVPGTAIFSNDLIVTNPGTFGTLMNITNDLTHGLIEFSSNCTVKKYRPAYDLNDLINYGEVLSIVSGLAWQDPAIRFANNAYIAGLGSKTLGDRYIVTEDNLPTWHEDDIIEWDGVSSWVVGTPVIGWAILVLVTHIPYTYTLTGWVEFGFTIDHLLAINTGVHTHTQLDSFMSNVFSNIGASDTIVGPNILLTSGSPTFQKITLADTISTIKVNENKYNPISSTADYHIEWASSNTNVAGNTDLQVIPNFSLPTGLWSIDTQVLCSVNETYSAKMSWSINKDSWIVRVPSTSAPEKIVSDFSFWGNIGTSPGQYNPYLNFYLVGTNYALHWVGGSTSDSKIVCKFKGIKGDYFGSW